MRYIDRVRKGDIIRLEVEDLDEEGAAVGTVANRRVHVAGAAPGERIEAEVAHLSPHRPEAWARLVRVVESSAVRRPPACPAYGGCGGCVLEHVDYPAQVAWKGARVQAACGGLASVEPCVPSPRALGYRNRSKLVYGRTPDNRRVLGAYRPRSHELVDLAGCRVAEPPLDEVAAALLAELVAANVEPYDEATGDGQLRYAVLRVNNRGLVLATLVIPSDDWPAGEPIARALRQARPEVVGVVANINPSRGNVIYGTENRLLDGAALLEEQVGEVALRLSPTAFFQVNRWVAERMYADARAAAALRAGERVVDCYSGVGGLALTLALEGAEVIGIEEVAAAVANARAAAPAGAVRFLVGDVATRLSEIDRADVVVLNPPRRGCAARVLEEVVRLGPRRVLYVSCSPESLARDLALLGARGLRTMWVRPYDMLPQTPHVEALALVERQS
jgi:23S rRNA (uracil1939-C5)-methyltransferase